MINEDTKGQEVNTGGPTNLFHGLEDGTELAAYGYPLVLHTMTTTLSFIFRGIITLLLFISIPGCHKKNTDTVTDPFTTTPVSKRINPGMIDEASGIADSKANAGYLWVEQDSGNPDDIYLLSYDGIVSKKINIKASINRDWED